MRALGDIEEYNSLAEYSTFSIYQINVHDQAQRSEPPTNVLPGLHLSHL